MSWIQYEHVVVNYRINKQKKALKKKEKIKTHIRKLYKWIISSRLALLFTLHLW